MSSGRAVPIVVGVGEIKNASKRLEDAAEPAELMLRAIQSAIDDCSTTSSADATRLQSRIDSIDVVATWTWSYPDLPGLLAKKLDVKPRHKRLSAHGGNSPGAMFDDAARRISMRESEVAVVTGGEALASCRCSNRKIQLLIGVIPSKLRKLFYLFVVKEFGRAQRIPEHWTEEDSNMPSIVSPAMKRVKES